jgi:hypothetical protein
VIGTSIDPPPGVERAPVEGYIRLLDPDVTDMVIAPIGARNVACPVLVVVATCVRRLEQSARGVPEVDVWMMLIEAFATGLPALVTVTVIGCPRRLREVSPPGGATVAWSRLVPGNEV